MCYILKSMKPHPALKTILRPNVAKAFAQIQCCLQSSCIQVQLRMLDLFAMRIDVIKCYQSR